MFEGFYTAYMSGPTGQSLAMFVFRDGIVAGADVGGGIYSGSYAIDSVEQKVSLLVKFILPEESISIAGFETEAEPIELEVPIELPIKIDPNAVFTIRTSLGSINSKFTKVRGF